VRFERHIFRAGRAREFQAVRGREAGLIPQFLLNLIVKRGNAIGVDEDRTVDEEFLALTLFAVCLVSEHQKYCRGPRKNNSSTGGPDINVDYPKKNR
jgi:hypothetical protein